SACDTVPARQNACLVGTWEVVGAEDNFRNVPVIWMMQMMALANGGAIEDIRVLEETYSFDRNGTFATNRPMRIEGRWNDGSQDVNAELDVRENSDTGRWGATGRQLTMCVENNAWTATLTATTAEYGTQSEDMSSDEPVLDEPPVTARYTCDGDELRISASPHPLTGGNTIVLRRR
ncbi:MAG: hypothetical protein AAF762_00480, partial [Pseudomonadota bacterium]